MVTSLACGLPAVCRLWTSLADATSADFARSGHLAKMARPAGGRLDQALRGGCRDGGG
jgi:hypothetical protein